MAKFAALFAAAPAAAGTAAAASGASLGLAGSGALFGSTAALVPATTLVPAAASTFSLGQILTGLGALSSALGVLQGGQNAELQAEIFRREAKRQRELSELEAAEFSRDTRRLMARQRALSGASGAVTGTGSFLDLSEDTAKEAEFQRLKILSGGQATSSRLRSQSILERQKSRQAPLRAGSILLRGVGETFGA